MLQGDSWRKSAGLVLAVSILLLGLLMTGCQSQEQGVDLSSGDAIEVPPLNESAADTTGRWDRPLAYIKGRPVTGKMVRHHMLQNVSAERIDALASNIDAMQIGVGTLLDQLAWAEAAEARGFKLTEDEQFQLEYLRTKLLADRYGKEIVRPLLQPDEDDLRTFYETNKNRFIKGTRVATAHVLVDSRAQADQILNHARNGEDFKVLARKFSQDELTKDIGGNQGWLTRQQPTLGVGKNIQYIRAAEAMEVGEFTVFQSDKGWHVIAVIDKEGGGAQEFEDVKEELAAGYRRDMFNAVYNIELYRVRRDANAYTDAEGMDVFCSTTNHVNRYFAIAMNTPRPDEKIELFRRLAFEYPNNPIAPQAMFMQAYFQLKDKGDHWESAYSAKRVVEYYPNTDWAKAAEYLLSNHIDHTAKPLPILPPEERERTVDLPAPHEILELAGI